MVTLLTPFTQVLRPSAPKADGVNILTGRFYVRNNAGQMVLPGSANKMGAYLALEGNITHIGGTTDFGGSAPFDSTASEPNPSVLACSEVGLAYGYFRAQVGPEGVDPAATYTHDALLTIDASGRLVPAGGGDQAVAKVEASATDGAGKVTSLTFIKFA
jgi:hypothetical protein